MSLALAEYAPSADEFVELRWLVRVDGAPAAHHTLRAEAELPFPLTELPRWRVSRLTWDDELDWRCDVTPRVLRPSDPAAAQLEIGERAPALCIHERAMDHGVTIIEHELVVLTSFASIADMR